MKLTVCLSTSYLKISGSFYDCDNSSHKERCHHSIQEKSNFNPFYFLKKMFLVQSIVSGSWIGDI